MEPQCSMDPPPSTSSGSTISTVIGATVLDEVRTVTLAAMMSRSLDGLLPEYLKGTVADR